jgi:hypothetical protein
MSLAVLCAVSPSPWSADAVADAVACAEEVLAFLPPAQRVMWRLVVVERRSVAEVSQLLGVSAGTLSRRVTQLRTRLGGKGMRRLMELRPVLPSAYFAAAVWCLVTGCGHRRLARDFGLPVRQAMRIRGLVNVSQSKGDDHESDSTGECYAADAV